MSIKTRLEILTDIEDELCVRLPIHIFPSDTNFNDRWVSCDSMINYLESLADNMSDELDIRKKIEELRK